MPSQVFNLDLSPDSANKRLGEAEALVTGHGQLQLDAYLRPDSAGAEVNAEARLTDSLSAFATAYGGVSLDDSGSVRPDFGALAGLRWRW